MAVRSVASLLSTSHPPSFAVDCLETVCWCVPTYLGVCRIGTEAGLRSVGGVFCPSGGDCAEPSPQTIIRESCKRPARHSTQHTLDSGSASAGLEPPAVAANGATSSAAETGQAGNKTSRCREIKGTRDSRLINIGHQDIIPNHPSIIPLLFLSVVSRSEVMLRVDIVHSIPLLAVVNH